MAANVYAINNIGFMIGNLMIGIIDDKIGHTGVFMFAIGLIISGQIMLTCSITLVHWFRLRDIVFDAFNCWLYFLGKRI